MSLRSEYLSYGKERSWSWIISGFITPNESELRPLSVGAKVKFLPPYSPDLFPIELCWSKLKQFLRSCEARTLESRWPCND
ncbi:hypothetical protein HCG51_22945 [Tolypothrix sp. PCC 7910]|nr:hypothetical protein HCG51_22945 [Tolypothrix sp. PCC 7910]